MQNNNIIVVPIPEAVSTHGKVRRAAEKHTLPTLAQRRPVCESVSEVKSVFINVY